MGFKPRRPRHLNLPSPHGDREPVELPRRTKPKRMAAILPSNQEVFWSKEAADDWQKTNKELAARAVAGDDESLFELLRRDPRLLSDDFVIEKLMEWKLICRRSHVNSGLPGPDSSKAAASLRKLGNAIASTSESKGNPNVVPRKRLERHYREVNGRLEEIQEAIKARRKAGKHRDANKLASDFGGAFIGEKDVEWLLAQPRSATTIGRTIAGRRFNLGPDQVKKILQKISGQI